MLQRYSSICLIAFLFTLFAGVLPSAADEIEIDPDALTFGGGQETGEDAEPGDAEDPEGAGVTQSGSGASEASLLVTLEDLFSGWLEGLRARASGWLCR